jgi:hypothetical protein
VDVRARVLAVNNARQRTLVRLDALLERDMMRVYTAARRELEGLIVERKRQLARVRGTGQGEAALLEALARDEGLFRQVDLRMEILRGEVAERARVAQGRALEVGRATAQDELEAAARGLDVGVYFNFGMINFDTVEIGLEEALRALETQDLALAQALRTGLRLGLIQGESFDDLAARLWGLEASVFSRGLTSALLGARRSVITAENGARDLVYRTYREQLPGLQKQAVAVISERTTECCLRVHGQVQPLEQPYQLDGEPRFADEMMYPSFHWNCRTASVAYMAAWEKDTRLPTAAMVDEAQEEQDLRNGKD